MGGMTTIFLFFYNKKEAELKILIILRQLFLSYFNSGPGILKTVIVPAPLSCGLFIKLNSKCP